MNIARDWTVFRYDQWLDLYGVPGRERKALRQELKANLVEAERAAGWPAARKGLGSVRELARDNAEAVNDPRRPAWSFGVSMAAVAFALVVWAIIWSGFAFADGVSAANLPDGQVVEGSVTLLPGSRFSVGMRPDGAFEAGATFSPWLVLGVPAVVFLVASRVWRVVTGRRTPGVEPA